MTDWFIGIVTGMTLYIIGRIAEHYARKGIKKLRK